MDDRQFCQLLHYFGLSWQGYRKVRKGVKKRIGRHMRDLGCRSMATYLNELTANGEAHQRCEHLMTVSISRFFRDRELWEIFATQIFPQLIERRQGKIRAWVAGCASGEEVYSLRIIWEHIKTAYRHLQNMEILATDSNPQYLERAKVGAYPSSSLKEVPEQLRSRYFHQKTSKNCYLVDEALKSGIILKRHNFLHDPLAGRFDIILLRNNLFTYYNDVSQISILKKVTDALGDHGYLIIGSHEKMPSEHRASFSMTSLPYMFKKVG